MEGHQRQHARGGVVAEHRVRRRADLGLAADFSLDGKIDIITTTDDWNYGFVGGASGTDGIGGIADYYVNNKTATPFSSGVTQHLTTHNNPTYDYDVGFVFDYDKDPNHTPDIMVADGNQTANFYVFANRVVNQYVSCGDVASGVIDLGALANSEMVVNSAPACTRRCRSTAARSRST